MPDRGKVISGMAHCGCRPIGNDIVSEGMCNGCPYCGDLYCGHNLMADALALLRAQEPVEPKKYMSRVNRTEYLCGACDSGILFGDEFCRHCGRKVKWDD